MEIQKLILNTLYISNRFIRKLEKVTSTSFLKRFSKYSKIPQIDGRIHAIKGKSEDSEKILEKHVLQGKKAIILLSKFNIPSLLLEVKRLEKSKEEGKIFRAIAICFEMSSIIKEMAIYSRKHKTFPIVLNPSRLLRYRRKHVNF